MRSLYGEERRVQALTDVYKGYYYARLTAIDQDKYLIKGLEDTTEATYDLNIAWDRLLDSLDTREAISRPQTQLTT